MKRFILSPAFQSTFLFCVLSLVLFSACKRDKLVESSQSARPAWVYGIERDYVIVEGRGGNHDEAKQKAFVNLRENIVNAVAVNVSSSVQMDVTEEIMDNLRQFRENTVINTTVSSDFLYALRGIQLNKAKDWYWEQRRTSEKVPYVIYHIKYPFSNSELNQYIREWESMDAALLEELHSLEGRIHSAATISELIMLQTEAENLARIFKEPRKSMAQNIQSRITQKIEQIELRVVSHQRGEIAVELHSNGQKLRATGPLVFTSTCCKMEDQKYSENEAQYIIHYDPTFCPDIEKSYFQLQTSIGDKHLIKSIAIPDDPGFVRLGIHGNLVLNRPESGNEFTWRLPLRLYGDAAIDIIEIEIEIERVNKRLLGVLSRNGSALNTFIRQPLRQHISGKGDHTVIFQAEKPRGELDDVFTSIFNTTIEYQASGKMYYKRFDGDERRMYRFENLQVDIR